MHKPAVLVVALAFAIALPVSGEVYKWVDAAGNVHYSDRPDDASAAEVTVRSKRTDQARITQQKQEKIQAKQQARLNDEEQAAKDQQDTENATRISENCRRAREALASLQNTQRLYVPEGNGERRYLSDEEREGRVVEALGHVREWCERQPAAATAP